MSTFRIFLAHGVLGVIGALLLGSAIAPALVLAQTDSAPEVFSVIIDEEIRAGTVQFLERSLREAAVAEADLFVLKLNTPGGLLSATEQMSRLLIDSAVPTAVYVYQDSGWAFSAGVFILLSADTAAMHPTASIGAASPILQGGGEADEKTINATIAWIESLAERNGRDATGAATFVTENTTLGGSAALEAGMVDILAADTTELLAEVGLAGAVTQELTPTALEQTLSFFSIPYLVPLLLTLGSLGLFFAFRTGEIEVLGVLSFILLLLGLWGIGSIQLSTLGVIILVLGIGLIVLELFLAGSDFGLSGILGIGALLFGIATFAQEPFFPSIIESGFLPILLAIAVVGGLIMFGISYFTASAIRQPHQVGVETMVGRRAEVLHPLEPKGVILIDGERYTARVDGTETVAETEIVEIVAMEGNVAVVRPVA